MYYKNSQISPNRQTSPIGGHKLSVPNSNIPYQQQYQSYYTSSKTTPIRNQEQKFETIKQGATLYTQTQNSPEKIKNYDLEYQILKNDLILKDQKNESLQKALDLANEDRYRLRSALEQKSISCVNKEREIAKLLATIHQIEFKKNDGQIIKDLQLQIETLKLFIQENALEKSTTRKDETQTLKNKLNVIQEQLSQSIKQNESLQIYVQDLMKQNKELSQKYNDKCIICQKLEMEIDQLQIMQRQLKGKEDEIEILKNELNGSFTKEDTNQEQQNEIQRFLSKIKQQCKYLEDSPKNEELEQESINVYRPIYSFQSTEDINKTETIKQMT